MKYDFPFPRYQKEIEITFVCDILEKENQTETAS
jgi:hypothetical protein